MKHADFGYLKSQFANSHDPFTVRQQYQGHAFLHMAESAGRAEREERERREQASRTSWGGGSSSSSSSTDAGGGFVALIVLFVLWWYAGTIALFVLAGWATLFWGFHLLIMPRTATLVLLGAAAGGIALSGSVNWANATILGMGLPPANLGQSALQNQTLEAVATVLMGLALIFPVTAWLMDKLQTLLVRIAARLVRISTPFCSIMALLTALMPLALVAGLAVWLGAFGAPGISAPRARGMAEGLALVQTDPIGLLRLGLADLWAGLVGPNAVWGYWWAAALPAGAALASIPLTIRTYGLTPRMFFWGGTAADRRLSKEELREMTSCLRNPDLDLPKGWT